MTAQGATVEPRTELREPNPQPSLLGGLWRLWTDARRHRHLVSNFVRRDLRLKYRNSALGYVWSVLEPLLLSGVYVVLFTLIAGKPEPAYPMWVVIGVIAWGLFSRSLTGAVTSLTSNEGLIKQVYLPRALFGLSETLAQLAMASLNLLVAVPFMIYFQLAPTRFLLMVPLGLGLVALLGLGVGLGLACLNVVLRDVEHFFRFAMRAGLYLSPVMWTVEMIPPTRSAALVFANPMTVPITMIRNGIGGQPLGIDSLHVAYSVAFCVLAFVVGVTVFQRYEARVAVKL